MSLNYFQIFIPIIATVFNIFIQILSFRHIAKLGLLMAIINKGETVKQNIEALKLSKKYGFRIWGTQWDH